MRSSIVHYTMLAVVGLTKAQTQVCSENMVDFEDLKDVASLGAVQGRIPIPNGYAGLNWANLYGGTVAVAAHLAGSIDLPATTPVVISTLPGRTISPKSVFLGTAQRSQLGGLASLSSASTIVVIATFKDRTTAQVTFNFDPPNTVFGLSINAEALQYFHFPCEWKKVVSLSFRSQAENGANILTGLGLDNFKYVDDTAA